MNELTQEQKLRQLDDILANAVELGQEIISDSNAHDEIKYQTDFIYQTNLSDAYEAIKNITILYK